jgi:magnesium and cobalt transporter
VTLDVVLEEIVGEIDDENDAPTEFAWTQADGSLRVLASADWRRVCERLGIEWNADTKAATLGGFVTECLGRLPSVGDEVRYNDFVFKVVSASAKRAELVVIERRSA